MKKCEFCGWLNSQEAHDLRVFLAQHLRLEHGLSRRKTAAALSVREKFVRDHAEDR